jgi:hypothetical protein
VGASGADAAASSGGFDIGALADFGGALADGGPIGANTPYLVGERGPEIRSFSTSGSIHPIAAGGGGSPTYNIDARGAELGAYNRIAAGMEQTHRAAVSDSVKAMHEQSWRRPKNTGRH